MQLEIPAKGLLRPDPLGHVLHDPPQLGSLAVCVPEHANRHSGVESRSVTGLETQGPLVNPALAGDLNEARAEGSTFGGRDEGRKGFPEELVVRDPQEGGGPHVGLQDPAVEVGDQVGRRSEVEELRVPFLGDNRLELRRGELLVLPPELLLGDLYLLDGLAELAHGILEDLALGCGPSGGAAPHLVQDTIEVGRRVVAGRGSVSCIRPGAGTLRPRRAAHSRSGTSRRCGVEDGLKGLPGLRWSGSSCRKGRGVKGTPRGRPRERTPKIWPRHWHVKGRVPLPDPRGRRGFRGWFAESMLTTGWCPRSLELGEHGWRTRHPLRGVEP